MKKIFIAPFAIIAALTLLLSGCKQNTTEPQRTNQHNASLEIQEENVPFEININTNIEPIHLHGSLRMVGFDVTQELLAPQYHLTQEEFEASSKTNTMPLADNYAANYSGFSSEQIGLARSMSFGPAEPPFGIGNYAFLFKGLGTNARNGSYSINDNLLDPTKTELAVKLRKGVANSNDYITSASNYKQYTVWNGRKFITGTGGKQKTREASVTVKPDGRGFKMLLPVAPESLGKGTDTWYMALAVGGKCGLFDVSESMTQYFSRKANGVATNIPNFYQQSNTSGLHAAHTEPNRFDSSYNLGRLDNYNANYVGRQGIQEVRVSNVKQTIKRNFPITSSFVRITNNNPSENNSYSGTITLKPRGSVLFFRLKNDTGKKIKAHTLFGSFGGKKEGTGTFETLGVYKDKYSGPRVYYSGAFLFSEDAGANQQIINGKDIKYDLTMSGGKRYQGTATNAVRGLNDAGVKSGEQPKFFGTTDPETNPDKTLPAFLLFPHNDSTTPGIVLEPGATMEGYLFLWFWADLGANFRLQVQYDVIEGTKEWNKKSKAQKINTPDIGNFQDGYAYGTILSIKEQ